MADRIDLVVFDMDGVLVDLDRARRLDLLVEAAGLSPGVIGERIWSSDFEPSGRSRC